MRDVWRFVATSNGAQFVITCGLMLMQQLFADIWDTLDSVCPLIILVEQTAMIIHCMVSDAQAFSNAFYGQGRGSIYLDNVQCSGSELDLFDCPGDNTPSCTQADAAGVRCNPTRMKFTQCWILFMMVYILSYLQLCVKRMQ